MPTGLATLDSATRDGLRTGVVVLAGPPGAGKTTLMVWLALRWAMMGVHVAVLAADEGADGLLVRIGQSLGHNRAELETGAADVLARFSAALADLPRLAIVDATESGALIEDLAADLTSRRAEGEPAILLVDSIQRARCAASDLADGPRASADAVMTSLRRATRDGLIVVVTSEVARGAYRSRDPNERTDALASAKESSGIEYGADLLLALRSVRGEPGVIDVEVPKNRWGSRPELRLRIDPDRASVEEIEAPLSDAADAAMSPALQLETDMTAAREKLRENLGLAGYERLRAIMGGMSMARRSAAVSALRASGEIVDLGTRQRPRLYLRGTEPGADSDGHTSPTGPTVGPERTRPTALRPPIGSRAAGRATSVGSDGEISPVGPLGIEHEDLL